MAYHISPKTGKPGKCVGQDRCRFGGENNGQGIEHFDNKEEANAFIEKSLTESHNTFSSVESGIKRIDKRIYSDEYVAMVADRDAKRILAEQLDVEYEELSKKMRKKAEQTPENEKLKHELVDKSREAYLDLTESKRVLREYQEETAKLVTENVEPFESEYGSEELGNLVKFGEFESGTKEWLDARQGSGDVVRIGGSDIGSILKLDPKYGSKNRLDALRSKVDTYEGDQEKTFAQAKGDTWEPYIVNKFAKNHPDYEIMHSKALWLNKDNPEFTANFDGLISSKRDGVPDGILEIKTASDARKWVDEDGNPSVPDGYRAQTLWYLHNTGFDYAHLAVVIDDNNYQEFRINRGEPINSEVGTIEDNIHKIKEFQQEARNARRHGYDTRGRNPNPNVTERNYKNIASQVAVIQKRDPEEVARAVRYRVKNQGETYQQALANELKAYKPQLEGVIALDVESTGFSVRTGAEVIELGAQTLDANGKVKHEFNELYKPDPRFSNSYGCGAEEVHGITMDDVKDKPMFKSPESKTELKKMFGKEATIMAHNASMEAGFLEHEFPDVKFNYIDTMVISKYFMTTDNNKMESFAEGNGVDYVNAHRALSDVDMMRRASNKFFGLEK